MPASQEFLAAFNLVPGTIFGNYKLVEANAVEQTVKRYREYRYNLTLIFTPLDSGTESAFYELLDNLQSTIAQTKVAYGIKNPYNCNIDLPSNNNIFESDQGDIIFYLTGHAYRA